MRDRAWPSRGRATRPGATAFAKSSGAVGERPDDALLAAHQGVAVEAGVRLGQPEPDAGPARADVLDRGRAGRAEPDGVDDDVVLAVQLASRRRLAPSRAASVQPGRRAVDDGDVAEPLVAGDEQADETDRPGSDDGDPLDRRCCSTCCQACTALARGSTRAAVSQVMPSGMSCTAAAGTATRSAKPPAQVHAHAARARGTARGAPRRHRSHRPQLSSGFTTTRRPSGVSPANSCPMISGGLRKPTLRKPCSSLPQMPLARTVTAPSPPGAAGVGDVLQLHGSRAR